MSTIVKRSRRGKGRSVGTRFVSEPDCDYHTRACSSSLGLHRSPYPPEMRVIFTSSITGYLSNATANTATYSVAGNYPYLPFSSGADFPNASPTASTLNPLGFKELMGIESYSGPYQQGIVIGSAIRVRWTSTSDLFTIVLVPVFNSAKYTSTGAAMSNRLAKSLSTSTTTPRVLENSVSTAQVVGVHNSKVLSEDDYIFSGSAPTYYWDWQFYWTAINQATGNNGGTAAYTVDVAYDTILLDLELEGMSEVSVRNRIKKGKERLLKVEQLDDDTAKGTSANSSDDAKTSRPSSSSSSSSSSSTYSMVVCGRKGVT